MAETLPRKLLRLILPAVALATAVVLAGCGAGAHQLTAATGVRRAAGPAPLPGTGKPAVIVGDKNFPEQFVLGALYSEALKAQGYSVTLNPNIGPTEVTLEALTSGRLSIYPEYLGVWNTAVAHYRHTFRTLRAAYAGARHWARGHGLILLHPTPFSDTGGIAATATYAAAHQLRTISDLRKVAPALTVGGPPQVQPSATALDAAEQVYGLVPAGSIQLAIGDQYTALDQGRVQAAVINTTDGQLAAGTYALLRDPRRAFGYGEAIPVVPTSVLAAEGPAFADTVNRVSALLTMAAIRELNAAVDIQKQDPTAVATRFLRAHGLVP